MPEDKSPPGSAHSDEKPSHKHKWRGKLFSTEGKLGRHVGDVESTDGDVAKFLHTAVTKPQLGSQPSEVTPRLHPISAPQDSSTTEASDSAPIVDVYRRAKPRQNKGIHVTFEAKAPKVIGEGGDEAELPPKDLYISLQHTLEPGRSQAHNSARSSPDRLSERDPRIPPYIDDAPSFRPTPLQRRPTGLSEFVDDDVPEKSGQGYDDAALPDLVPPSSVISPLLPSPHRIQDQESHVSHDYQSNSYQDVSPLEEEQYSFDGSDASHIERPNSSGTSAALRVPSPQTVTSNPATRDLSPHSYANYQQASASSYNNPPSAQDKHTLRKPLNAQPSPKTQLTKETPSLSEPKGLSLRNVAKGLADDSLDLFDTRVRRFNDIFRLGVSAHTDVMGLAFAEWIRIAAWWFLKGRAGLENEVRGRNSTTPQSDPSPMLKQAYVNLAKAWWIVKDVTPNHPEVNKYGKASMNSLYAIMKSFGDDALAEVANVHVNIVANMRALAMSMKRNGKLPPPDLEIQRLDLHVLHESRPLPSEIAHLLNNNSTNHHVKGQRYIKDTFFSTPIGDTERHFNFGRMFVEVSSQSSDNEKLNVRVPCIVTVLRDRTEWGAQISIASQDGQINLVVSDEIEGGLTWKRVQWKIASHEMTLQITNSFELLIKFYDKDFKTLWGICDYTQTIRKGLSLRRDERLIFERTLESFQCEDTSHFPSEAIAKCSLRVFEKERDVSEGSRHNRTHSGYRLAVITPPHIKTLSSVNYDCGKENPILFGIHRGSHGSRLVLRILPSSTRLSFGFRDTEDLDLFRHMLSGTSIAKTEHRFPSLQVRSVDITALSADTERGSGGDILSVGKVPWSKLRVIRKGSAPQEHQTQSTSCSDHLRILTDSDFGTLTDRINLGPGELQVGLDADDNSKIRLLRPPQSDMTWSLADDRVPREDLSSICNTLKYMLVSRTIRSYHFRSLKDAHSFQTIVTGFAVLFDGVVNSFAITRRRMVVPMHKRWEATFARLQIVKQDRTVQFIAFFKDFSHGACMNFVLKVTDNFEAFSKSGLFYLRIVDAKFALPKGQEDQSRDFINLDMPEYPGEHDDVTIGFENEDGRSQLL